MIVRRLLSLLVWAIWIALGAALGMELSGWADRQRAKMQPSALTGALLDKVNESLEQRKR